MRDTIKNYFRYTSWPIILAMLTLMVLGIGAIRLCEQAEGLVATHMKKQVVFACVGVLAFVITTVIPYRTFGQMAYALFGVTLGLLVLLFALPPIRGAHRWINLRLFLVQPSEFTKLTYIILLAWYLRYGSHYRRLRGMIVPFVLTFLPMGLILVEPDLGTSLLFPPTLYFMLFMAGAKIRHLLAIVLLGTAVLFVPVPRRLTAKMTRAERRDRKALAYWHNERYVVAPAPLAIMAHHQVRRIDGWIRQADPEIYRDKGFHLRLSKIVLGSGKMGGRSRDVREDVYFRMLPDDHTDFILSVIGGQWGFVGCAALLFLYAVIFLFGVEIAVITYDPFSRLLAVGVLGLLFSQLAINIGMTMGLMPITGMTLPLVSYGGSSLVVNCVALGLLVNVGQRRPILLGRRPFEHGEKKDKPPAPYGPLSDEPNWRPDADALEARPGDDCAEALRHRTVVSPARRLKRHLLPRRMPLRLPDGYETSVYIYGQGGRGGLPVLYLHGIQSHPGWFVGSAAALAQAGHKVYQVARRGSGPNQRGRGHAAGALQLLDDVDAAVRFVLQQSGHAKLHLLGVSWGGKLAAAYAAKCPRAARIASLTLVTPGIAPRVDICLARKIHVGLCLLLRPRRRFDIPLDDVSLFTKNDEMQEYLRDDPLRLHQATARFLWASRRLDGMLDSWRLRAALKMPVTLVLARWDEIIDGDATTEAVRRITAGDVDVQELPGSHTLEFEQDPKGLYKTLVAAVRRAEGKGPTPHRGRPVLGRVPAERKVAPGG